MSFGNPSNNRLGILGSLCSSGGVGSQTTLRAGCANSGSATNVRLWDSFKASGTLTVNPTSGSATENDDFDVEQSEDTLTILSRYLDEAETDIDKSAVRDIIKNIYQEACEVV